MQIKKQQFELDMEQQTGSKLGKEYVKAVFNFYAEYIIQEVGLHESQAGIKTAWRNINNLRYADVVVQFISHVQLTLCDPMECSPPVFSVHGISQARIL